MFSIHEFGLNVKVIVGAFDIRNEANKLNRNEAHGKGTYSLRSVEER